MTLLSLFLAAGSFLPYVLAAPAVESTLSFRIGTTVTDGRVSNLEKRKDAYKTFMGAAESATWPSVNQWVPSYDAMFNSNKKVMKQSCQQWKVPNNSDQEINDIYNAIKQVSGETKIDARFILAVLMQESNGCVRVPTTNWGVRNPGLMQDHDGTATCNEGGVQTPCPSDTIIRMIRDGVAGTPKGDGLLQLLQKSSGSQEAKYYKAARMYNSGSIDPSGHLEHGIATHCYVSDVANRLTGWVHSQKTCSLDGTPAPASAPPSGEVDAEPEAPFTPPSLPAAAPPSALPVPPAPPAVQISPKVASPPAVASPVQPPSSAHTVWYGDKQPSAEVTTKTATKSGATRASSSKKAPGVTSDCAQYYRVRDGDFCIAVGNKFALSFARLRELNTQLNTSCSNLWLDYDYCVKGLEQI